MEINVFRNRLSDEMQKGLPGWDVQSLMSARGRKRLSGIFIAQRNPRRSGVLVWLYPQKGSVFTRLILRTQYKGVHSGQVSFPGGAMEESDADLWHTALREANEEVGLPAGGVEKVGGLSPLYIPPSNFWVQPYVGVSQTAFKPVIDSNEVQCTIDADILTLLKQEIKEKRMIRHSGSGTEQLTSGYNIQGNFVWGATAMILSELEELLRRIKQTDHSLTGL